MFMLFFVPYLYKRLLGDDELNGIKLTNTKTGDVTSLAVNGLFVAIGQQPDNDRFADISKLNEVGYIIADESCLTDTPGVFVAGDCRTKAVRQVTTAAADGTIAAVAACRYLDA